MVLLAMDHFSVRCLWQKDPIRADAKCQTYTAYNDFFPVQRDLLKDGILLCLQNCTFQLPSYMLAIDHFLATCLWQKDAFRADAKCQTHIAYNDFFPVHRGLLKDGILLCLRNCIFQLPSYRLEGAFGSNYYYKNRFDSFDTVSILFTICCVLSAIDTKFGFYCLPSEKKRNKWCLLLWKLSYHGNGELQ